MRTTHRIRSSSEVTVGVAAAFLVVASASFAVPAIAALGLGTLVGRSAS